MSSELGRIEFGGPDLPPYGLRDLLERHVDDAPPGSRIDWATYYFRDRALAAALMRASDRGVRVRLVVEPSPRRAGANDAVITMLADHGLGGGFHLYRSGRRSPKHLHVKIYVFSHPEVAWIGSFNPSGDTPEDADVIAEIGDQDRGHNLLLGIEQPRLISALRELVGALASPSRLRTRFHPSLNASVDDGDTQLFFYPRLKTILVEREIGLAGAGDRIRGAVSHLKSGAFATALERAVSRGVAIDLAVHDTERRVPSDLVQRLLDKGVRIRRIRHPEGLPMHAKFVLIDRGKSTAAWLGSYNFNFRSRFLNAELLLRTSDGYVVDSLGDRFAKIAAMADWTGGIERTV